MARPRSHGIVTALLFGTVLLIVYGSLFPFDLRSGAETPSLAQALLELSWARSGRGDRIANVLLYAPLGFCLLLWLSARVRRGSAVVGAFIFGVALSFSIELAQVFVAPRVPSWRDVMLNAIGALIGIAAGLTWHALGGRMRSATAHRQHESRSAWLVIAFWLAWRFAPFVPEFSLGKLKSAFAPLASPYFSTGATLHYWIWWTLMAYVVFSMVAAQRATEALLALIAVVLASHLVIVDHAFLPAELLALLLLMPTLFVFDRLTPTPRAWLLFIALAGVMLHDAVTPMASMESTQRFDLWPFMTWMNQGFPLDWEWLARRACQFAMLTWALSALGMRAVLIVPLIALGIEVLQLWMPQERSSITEPALALLVAWSMRVLDEGFLIHRRARSR